jgi:hypothetical protein
MYLANRRKFPALVNGMGRFVKQPFGGGLARAQRAAHDDEVVRPGHRASRIAKFELIGPGHPNYAQQDGIWQERGRTRARAQRACFDACLANGATRDLVFSDPRR